MGLQDFNSTKSTEIRYVSTAQVARALGVSVTTVKRWVDDRILPAHRTAGGHRKLLLADVLRLARDENLPQADLSSLIPRPQATELEDPRAIHEQLLKAASLLDAPLIRAILHGAYLQGYSIETLADRVISPVMAEIGHGWEVGRVDVSHEHRVTQAIVAALYELRTMLRGQWMADRPLAVGGSPEHDHYAMASLLGQLVLLDSGWEAIHLGPHTPVSAFVSTIERFRPRLVWLSVSHLRDPDRFVDDCREIYDAAEAHGTALALGGRALTGPIRQRLHYTTFGDGLTQLAAFARTLHRLPSRPRRGRPKGARNSEGVTESEEPSGAGSDPTE